MTLHLVRIAIEPRALAAYAIAHRADDDDRGYATHLALRRRYGAAAPQPFRLIEESSSGPHLLGYVADAQPLVDAAALPAEDQWLEPVFPEQPVCRAMPETWRTGARYAFEVRVRPVVRFGGRVRARRKDQADAWQRGAGEIDAFVAACEKAEDAPHDRAEVYRAWLVGRFGAAAAIERAEPRLMRRLVTRRSSHGRPGARRIEGYEAVFGGVLRVADGEVFAALLARGLGRHAAFGFGMVLLAPPGPG